MPKIIKQQKQKDVQPKVVKKKVEIININESFDSAKKAFQSLNIGKKLSKRLISKKTRKFAKAMDIELTRYDGNAASWLIYKVFNISDIGIKSRRVGQLNDTESIMLFSDEYNQKDFSKIQRKCLNHGLQISTFEKTYPRTQPNNGFMPKKTKIYNCSSNLCYRGRLVGFIIH